MDKSWNKSALKLSGTLNVHVQHFPNVNCSFDERAFNIA